MTEHVEKTEDAVNSLGSHRRHSHARGSHMEDDDKEKVQNDIQDGRKNQGKKRGPAVSDRPQNRGGRKMCIRDRAI